MNVMGNFTDPLDRLSKPRLVLRREARQTCDCAYALFHLGYAQIRSSTALLARRFYKKHVDPNEASAAVLQRYSTSELHLPTMATSFASDAHLPEAT